MKYKSIICGIVILLIASSYLSGDNDNILEEKELEEVERKEAEANEKERIRLANINNTGMWVLGYYVDMFGEPTGDRYITNRDLISGTFSNTATQNSELNVEILITNKKNMAIILYEYAMNNPVKTNTLIVYTIYVKDNEGNILELEGRNSIDKIHISPWFSLQLHDLLIKGGSLAFRIIDNERTTSNYIFKIQNADFYENAYSILTGM